MPTFIHLVIGDDSQARKRKKELIQNFLFPNGMPESLERDKVFQQGAGYHGDQPFYMYDESQCADIKQYASNLNNATERDEFIKDAISVLNAHTGEYEGWIRIGEEGDTEVKHGQERQRILSIMPSNTRAFTIEEVELLMNGKKIPKGLLRSVINKLDLEGSGKDKMFSYMLDGRVEAFRLLNERGLQFTKEQLSQLIDSEPFNNPSSSGVFGGSDRADVVNRRSVVFHQDACDSDLVFRMLDSIKDQKAKEAFILSLTRWSKVREKFKDDPRLALLLKLI
jgi:hypothetical protein